MITHDMKGLSVELPFELDSGGKYRKKAAAERDSMAAQGGGGDSLFNVFWCVSVSVGVQMFKF